MLKMESLAKPAIDVVREGEDTSLFLKDFEKTLLQLDGKHSRLVYFKTIVVGPQNTCMVLWRLWRNETCAVVAPRKCSKCGSENYKSR